jgi:WD40 repeat protein
LPAKETNIAVAGNRRLFGLDRDTRDLFVADDSGDKLGAWVRLEIGNPRPISVVASTAGETVAITTREGEAQPHTPPFIKNHRLELFPVSNPTARRVLAVHHWDRGPPRFSEDGQFLVWSDQDNETLTVWRVADGELICVIPQSRKPMAYALSSDGRLVAYSTDIEHHCHVWSVPDNREVVSVTIPGVATALAFHPNGSLIVGCTHLGSSDLFDIRKGTLWIRDGVTGRTRWIRTNENGVLARVLISPDGRFVATLSGMSAYRLQVWRWDQLAP